MPIDFPNSPTTNQTFTVGNRTWQYDGEKWGLLALSTTNNIPISLLDIDGGTEIGAALLDNDLFVVDDGANGTNRSSTISRIYNYITSKFSSLGATGQNVRIGVTAAGEIDTTSGNLTIDSAGGTVTIDDNLTVNGNLVVSGRMNEVVAPALTGGEYQLVLSDANKILEFTATATVRVPGSGTAFAVGTSITIVQQGTGIITIAAVVSSGVNLRSSTGTKTRAQYSVATLIKRSDTEWWVMGDTTP